MQPLPRRPCLLLALLFAAGSSIHATTTAESHGANSAPAHHPQGSALHALGVLEASLEQERSSEQEQLKAMLEDERRLHEEERLALQMQLERQQQERSSEQEQLKAMLEDERRLHEEERARLEEKHMEKHLTLQMQLERQQQELDMARALPSSADGRSAASISDSGAAIVRVASTTCLSPLTP